MKPAPKNAPAFDIGAELTRLLGVDLRTIDGVNIHIAQTVYTEVGPDLSAFPTEGNFISWLARISHTDVIGPRAGVVTRFRCRDTENGRTPVQRV